MTARALPDYGGGSIVNLAASILDAYGVPLPNERCRQELLPADLLTSRSGIVLFICDALGLNQLRYALDAQRMTGFERLASNSVGVRQLTSVFPSTTTAALTSLSTACTPAQHGIVGHRQWIDEVGSVCDMLRFSSATPPHVPFDEEIVTVVPTMFERLGAHGVRSFNVSASAYEGTAFSSLLTRGSSCVGYQSISEIPHLIESAMGSDPSFHFAYWAMVDTLAHLYGATSGQSPANPSLLELSLIDRVLSEIIEVCDRHDRLLLFVADHGQTNLAPDRALVLDSDVAALLRHPPGGGRRAAYLTSDEPERVAELPQLQQRDIDIVRTDSAVDDNWFGGSCEGIKSRLGQLILLTSSDRQILFDYGYGLHPNRGAHGGLSSDEMLVPLLVHH